MDAQTSKILDDALRLPPEGRAALAGSLLQSLEDKVDPDAESLWAEEIQRRIADMDSGRTRFVPWSEARKAILQD